MVERRVSWEFILVALIFTGAIMGGIFFMGKALSQAKIDRVENEIQEFNVERDSQELSQKIATSLPGNNCEALNVAVRQTVGDVQELQEKVSRYESSRRLRNGDFKLLKKRYMNLLLEYWLTARKVEKQCGSEVVKLLYLYADPANCPRCQDQGVIISSFKRQYGNRLLVFPLDTSLDMAPINLLIGSYDIQEYPAMIVEGNVYSGFMSKEELGNVLDDYMNATEG
ncbi:MAG: hypothetical protein SVQ76_00710 [Candidatus Nanohaloarchaea archaeon]|nr:hypothetical protein [Candidatus Nanohaloarchaea archaeon]